MQYLNKMYYGGTTVTYYDGQNKKEVTCPTNKLDNTAKSLIDNHTWNTGTPNNSKLYDSTTKSYDTVEFYKAERGNETGRICNGGDACNDTVEITTTWTGYIGLPYITDYAYASSESDCNTKIDNLYRAYRCRGNNWMFKPNTWYWTLSPNANSGTWRNVWYVYSDGSVERDYAATGAGLFPAIYLKTDILIESGTGTNTDPYTLKLSN